ncbi:MAG: carbonic anhydrase [Leptolyngbyaceae cyanobacterium bins.59]|nr:carbonic anhydrase [Leptolyngbyaceae cyanobacterium bins.59]
MERRDFLKLGAMGTIAWGLSSSSVWADGMPPEQVATLDPDTALQKLMAGNQRFATQRPQHPDQSQLRLKEVAESQHPFATILSCADSRVPAEIIFDQGIGSLFDVRIAGNIATPEAIGSVEYAVALLGTPVLMVLGHERCGAVTAAVKNEALPGEIGSFVNAILPALEQVKGRSGDSVNAGVIANVSYQMERLKASSLLTERLIAGKLKIVGGYYDLDTGRVRVIA